MRYSYRNIEGTIICSKVSQTITKNGFFSYLPSKYSFNIVTKKTIVEDRLVKKHSLESVNKALITKKEREEVEENLQIDNKKRLFLKTAGAAGIAAAVFALVPKKAEALVLGSTPTSNFVGVKNNSDIKINPATEDTLALIKDTDGIKKITDPLPAGANTIGSVNLTDITVLLRSLLNAVANPIYIDKSANAIRNQVQSGTITTVTTVSTVTTLGSLNSYNANQLVQQTSLNAWYNGPRSLIT
jgi:hypothetical protein